MIGSSLVRGQAGLRCGGWCKYFDKEKDLQAHKDQEPRIDCPDLREEVHRIESMSEGTFRKVKNVLSTKRGATDEQRKEEPKWFAAQNLIFPPTIYPNFPDPETPCKLLVFYAPPL